MHMCFWRKHGWPIVIQWFPITGSMVQQFSRKTTISVNNKPCQSINQYYAYVQDEVSHSHSAFGESRNKNPSDMPNASAACDRYAKDTSK